MFKKKVLGFMLSAVLTMSLFTPVAHADNSNGALVLYDGYGSMMGSAFFIKDGYVVTNNHVVQDRENITAYDEDGNSYTLDLITKDSEKDLALLSLQEKTDTAFYNIAEKVSYNPGEKHVTIGSTPEDRFQVKEGSFMKNTTIMTKRPSDSGVWLGYSRQTRSVYSFIADYGNSGSPVIDQNGEIVGVISARMDEDGKAVVIKLKDIKEFTSRYTP